MDSLTTIIGVSIFILFGVLAIIIAGALAVRVFDEAQGTRTRKAFHFLLKASYISYALYLLNRWANIHGIIGVLIGIPVIIGFAHLIWTLLDESDQKKASVKEISRERKTKNPSFSKRKLLVLFKTVLLLILGLILGVFIIKWTKNAAPPIFIIVNVGYVILLSRLLRNYYKSHFKKNLPMKPRKRPALPPQAQAAILGGQRVKK